MVGYFPLAAATREAIRLPRSSPAPDPGYEGPQYSSHTANVDMTPHFVHPNGGMFVQQQPDWTGCNQYGHQIVPDHALYTQPNSALQQQRSNEVRQYVLSLRLKTPSGFYCYKLTPGKTLDGSTEESETSG